jgi:hypothetical protein
MIRKRKQLANHRLRALMRDFHAENRQLTPGHAAREAHVLARLRAAHHASMAKEVIPSALETDRRRWRHWLCEARRRYRPCVPKYRVTSNHVQLLALK